MITPKRDIQTVKPDGKPVAKLIDGVTFKEMRTQVDERGFLCEMYDSRWDWHKDPLVYSYVISVRPGIIKGWAVHKKHEDRYFVISGDLEVVLYDGRKDSPTKGLVSKIYLTDSNRRLMNIPIGVWHATRNVGLSDVILVNFPTICYSHENPDKYRLPLNTKKIPYSFKNPVGW